LHVPVDDAGQREHAVGDEAFLHRADQRDAAGHGGLEPERHAAPARLVVELGAVVGEQGLVGGDHVLAGGERFQDERARRLQAAHQLDHDVNGRIGDHLGRRRSPWAAPRGRVPRAGE
jgi:hypothetical protein